MKKTLLLILFILSASYYGISQKKIDENYKKAAVDRICQIINENYVFPDVGEKTSEHLQAQLKAGAFKKIDNDKEFAEALTLEVQSINNDKHMRIQTVPPRKSEDNSNERIIENQLDYLHRKRESVGGFSSVQRLEGNVGYLDYRGFYGMNGSKEVIDSYMYLLETADAIVIDLRKNGGGSPQTVQYLCSFFFDEHVHLNSLYFRITDETTEYWTLDEVGGEKLPEVPLFIITSSYTFSGAEEFSYNMKTQKRGVLVGEVTGGGANPGGGFPVNPDLIIFVPSGTAINPITKTNWEGVGVIPDIETTPEEAYDKAIELANEAAEKFRNDTDERINTIYNELLAALDNAGLQSDPELSGESEDQILSSCKKCVEQNVIGEGEINILGYNYLLKDQVGPALALFKANVDIFPDSPNVYDSYAEALASSGNKEESKTYYEKAVQKAEEIDDPQIDLYKENLENIKKDLSKK